MKRWSLIGLSILLVLVLSPPAWATNGMETLAWSARAAGMAGVDLAVATDATAINTNPAGLMQLTGHHLDFGASLLFPTLHFKNDLNDEDGAFQVFPMPEIAYGYRFSGVPLAVGFGIFAQGGMGADFELTHAMLGKQDYQSQLAYAKAAPAIAWRPAEWLSVGAAVNVGYAQMGMKMPYSIHPSMMGGTALRGDTELSYGALFENMLGYDELTAVADLEGANAVGFGGKIGILIQPSPKFSFGAAYTPQSDLTFNGTAKMDMAGQFDDALPRMVEAFMLMPGTGTQEEAMQAVQQFFAENDIDPSRGYAAEYDAEIEFSWPQKLGGGIAYRPTDAWLIGLDVTWINWAATMEKFKMTMTGGDNANINHMMGGDKVVAEIPLNWEDQIVVSAGGQWEFVPNAFGRVGYNYAKNPVPDDTVFPVFPAIVEHHAALGGGYRFSEKFELNAAYELAVPNTQKAAAVHKIASEYNDSESTLGEHTVHIMGSFNF